MLLSSFINSQNKSNFDNIFTSGKPFGIYKRLNDQILELID